MKTLLTCIFFSIYFLYSFIPVIAQELKEEELKKAHEKFEKSLKGRKHHLDYLHHLLLNNLEHSKDMAKALHDHNDSTHNFDFLKRETSLLFKKVESIEIEQGVTFSIFLAKFNNDLLDEHYSIAITVYEVERKRLVRMASAGYWKVDEIPKRLVISNEYYFKEHLKKLITLDNSEIVFELSKDYITLNDVNINKNILSSSEREELTKDWDWWEKKINPSINFFESISIYTLGKGHTKIRLGNGESIEVTADNLFPENE